MLGGLPSTSPHRGFGIQASRAKQAAIERPNSEAPGRTRRSVGRDVNILAKSDCNPVITFPGAFSDNAAISRPEAIALDCHLRELSIASRQ